MDENSRKFYGRLILLAAITLNSIIWAVAAYNITDRLAPIRSVQTVLVK